MATFPPLEPNGRAYDLSGELPVVVERAWPAGTVRYRVGFDDRACAGLTMKLGYVERPEAEIQQIRDHYNFQIGGVVPFLLPAVIFQGLTTPMVPTGTQWRYVEPPREQQKSGDRIDMTVTLEAMAYVAPAA